MKLRYSRHDKPRIHQKALTSGEEDSEKVKGESGLYVSEELGSSDGILL
jgi:hypothetical protein